MSEDFRRGLDAIAETDIGALQELVAQAEERIYDADFSRLDTSDEYVGKTPPTNLLHECPASAKDVADAIEQTNLRWRLDVVMALDDYPA